MTTDLIARLRAALDTVEAAAWAVPLDLGHTWSDPGPWVMAGAGGGPETEVARAADGLEMPLAERVAHHIARHDPVFVLADIAAKRAIIDLHVLAEQNDGDGFTTMRCMVCDPEGSEPFYPCVTLRLLAEAYGITVGGSTHEHR